ncbi:PD-(D/E)XK nuclease domain-containing protein [Pontibacter sp. G13]|uniref:PD-(D/E)XK nuclease domain-containing protein n=1 Tax=Pontibacter sp. G13 TaxID=3074898 RepID=UPI003905E214
MHSRHKSANQALDQIHQRKYYEQFFSKGKEIYLLGISFSSKTRNVSDWKLEPLPYR